MWNVYRSSNVIIKTYMNNAVYNLNTYIGYKLSFLRYTILFRYVFSDVHLDVHEQAIVDTLMYELDNWL